MVGGEKQLLPACKLSSDPPRDMARVQPHSFIHVYITYTKKLQIK